MKQVIDIPEDTNTHVFSIFVKKDNDETRFPEFQASILAGATEEHKVQLNTKTGATNVRVNTAATDSHRVDDYGDWWRLSLNCTNDGSGTTFTAKILPSITAVIGGVDATVTGSVVLDQAQIELNQSYPSSPIITEAAAVSRATEAGEADVSGAQWDLDESGQVGQEMVTNGNFADWTGDDPDDWTVTGEVASDPMVTEVATGARMYTTGDFVSMDQNVLISGRRYKCVVVVPTVTAEEVIVKAGNITVATIAAPGTYTVYFTADATSTAARLRIHRKTVGATNDFIVASISVKEVTNSLTSLLEEQLGDDLITNGDFAADSGWTKGTGWTINDVVAGKAHCDGTQVATSNLFQDASLVAGTLYKAVYTISNRSAGSAQLQVGGAAGTGFNESDGTYTYYMVAAGNSLAVINASSTFVGTIDNVVVTEVLNDSRGTLVVDWTPGASADIPVSTQSIITPRDSPDGLLSQQATNNRFTTNDGASATTVGLDWDANVKVRLIIRWGMDTSNVRQMSVSHLISGSLTSATLVDYDGAYIINMDVLLACRAGTFPQQIKNIQFFNRVLTDAEIERL
jgi:hypothetical protein